MRKLVLVWFLIGFGPNVLHADMVCDPSEMRDARPDELALMRNAAAAARAVFPAPPKGWEIRDDDRQYMDPNEKVRLCGTDYGKTPMQLGFSRRIERTGDQDARNAKTLGNMKAQYDKIEEKKKGNAAKLAEIDKRIEKLTQEMTAAAGRQDFARIENISKQVQSLTEQKMKLAGVPEADAAIQADAVEANRDTSIEVSVSVNRSVEVGYPEPPKRLQIPGVDFAIAEIREQDSANHENTEVIVLLGSWRQGMADACLRPFSTHRRGTRELRTPW